MLVLFPSVKGLHVIVRASRSADPTSLALSHRSVIAQTRERNFLKYGAILSRVRTDRISYSSPSRWFPLSHHSSSAWKNALQLCPRDSVNSNTDWTAHQVTVPIFEMTPHLDHKLPRRD